MAASALLMLNPIAMAQPQHLVTSEYHNLHQAYKSPIAEELAAHLLPMLDPVAGVEVPC